MSYIELHARSAFSFLRGASRPEDMAARAAAVGLAGVALCDRNGFYGSVRFHQRCLEEGIRPFVGCELTLEDGSVVPLLVASAEGYRKICRLLTTSRLRAPKGEGRICWDELSEVAGGVIALTGDEEGPVIRAWREEGGRAAAERIGRLTRAFGADHVYVEVQRHHRRGETARNRFLVDLAGSLSLPLLATNGPAYATADRREVLDVFTCLHQKTNLDLAGRLLEANSDRQIKNSTQMTALFRDLPEAILNTERLAGRLDYTLENLGYAFPDYPVPDGESMDSFLTKLTWFGAEQRYGGLTPPIRRQLRHEMALITKLGFSGYFLIVWDIVNFCRERGIMVQGRGSAANSAVCYSLGITAVDPIGGRLLFERFLSEGRKGWPDIDLDLPSGDRREQVIQEVYRRYTRRGAAMTANVITYRGRSTVREVGKVLNLPEEAMDRFSKLYAHGDFPHTLELQEQLRQSGIAGTHPRAAALVRLYQSIYGLPRHLGQHSGGMIICQGRLDTVVPLENAAMPDRSVAQWDKDDCEDMGMVKVDLLGLGMMAVLQDAIEVTRDRGHPVDLAHIPKDDPATFKMLQEADTIGVFQVESRAQMATLPRMKPETFYDLVIEVAIIRPGPIQGKMVNPYLERRAGRQPVHYIDPRLEPILERTLGVPLFQEQMLKIAMVMANFSGSEAEELRRALSFHRSQERMDKVKVKLRNALEKNGVQPKAIEEITAAISSFALYGFPESHAISFALLAYGSAYLKAHRPAEFYAALINNQPMGFYSPATLVQDARRHGVRTLPVDVTLSNWECTVVDDSTIRLGLCVVEGVHEASGRAMLEARRRQPFKSTHDFLLRTGFSRHERRALASVGALNALSRHRRAALWAVETDLNADDLLTPAMMVAEESGRAGYVAGSAELSPLEMMTHLERLRADYRGMSLTTGAHPMKTMRPRIPHVRTAASLVDGPNGSRVTVAGAVICRQRPGTAKGFVFVSLEDETGISNAIVKPDKFEKERLIIVQEPFLSITGRLQIHDGVIHIMAEKIEPLLSFELPPEASHDFH
ncbi:MAG: error-prone DNA polymerase [Opitutaceae bacterium]